MRGTNLKVISVTKNGDDAGTAIVEGPTGEKLEILLTLKDTGEFVADRCLDVLGKPGDCRDVEIP